MKLIRPYNRNDIQKAVVLSLMLALVSVLGYVGFEPVLTSAASDSEVIVVTLDVTAGISLDVDDNSVAMSRSITSALHTAVGSSVLTVITNNSTGYNMTVAASTNPALQSGSDYVDDYATTTASGPSTWSVSSGDAKFGFSVFGADVVKGTSYWGTDSDCLAAAHTPSATLKYNGFYTVATTTSLSAATTTPSGTATTLCYAVEQNGTFIPSGTYTATITATATTN